MKRTLTMAPLAVALILAVSGCQSVPDPATIPPETTVAELSQSGQDALDGNKYRAAEVYYQIIIDRYNDDMAARTAAEFEIAHIRMKGKHWEDAAKRLDVIIERYEAAGGAELPPEYLVLARNDRKRIPANVLKALNANKKTDAAQ